MTKRIKILFKMFFLYHKAAFDPLIKIFENDSKYDVYLSLTDEKEKVFGIFNKDHGEKHLNHFQSSGHQISDENEQFDVVIAPDVLNEKKYKNALLCLVYHGITFTKTVTYRELSKHAHSKYMIFVEGGLSAQKLISSGCLGKSDIFEVGYPKLDPYFNNRSYNRTDILNSLGLDPNKKTVLFAPTYKPTCIDEIKDKIFIDTLDYNLIIKLHHYSWLGKYASHSHHRIFEKEINNYPHAIIIPKNDYNIVPLLYIADTLISEASGAITEFLAIGKTGIIFDLENDLIRHSDGQPLLNFENKIYLQNAFIHIDSDSNIKEAIEKALNPTEKMKRLQKIERDKIFIKLDGEASMRIKDKIELMLNR